MADPDPDNAGAPVAKDAIDPELVKLRRKAPKVGIVTAAGLVFLCAFFIVRLMPDRAFGGNETPARVGLAEILGGKISTERLVTVAAEPLVSHAVRTTVAKGNLGLRVVPARGSNEKLWMVVSGDGFDAPSSAGYTGRLRKLDDMPFSIAVHDYAHDHPRVEFVRFAEIKATPLKTIGGDPVTVAATDKVAYDLVDPAAATIVASDNAENPHEKDAAAWTAAIAAAGITAKVTPLPDTREERFDVEGVPDAVATVTKQLEAAKLYATRVEPVTRHVEQTWADFTGKAQPAGIDLVGLYVDRDIPADAYVLVTGENPADYWYILPIMIGLAVLGLVFLWALVRAVRRDLLSPSKAA